MPNTAAIVRLAKWDRAQGRIGTSLLRRRTAVKESVEPEKRRAESPTRPRRDQRPRPKTVQRSMLALTGLEALLRLVDDIDAALATHEAVVAMTVAQGFQRITDFHGRHQGFFPRRDRPTADKRRALYASNCLGDQERCAACSLH